jgi:hypothetical protein
MKKFLDDWLKAQESRGSMIELREKCSTLGEKKILRADTLQAR